VAAALVLVGAVAGVAVPAPRVSSPPRAAFDEFPSQLGDWWVSGKRWHPYTSMRLRLDDYVLASYHNSPVLPSIFYAAYYRSQDSSRAIHSPHDCIPGGGWQIKKLERRQFPGAGAAGAFPVNRAVIQLGPTRQIVYYCSRSEAVT